MCCVKIFKSVGTTKCRQVQETGLMAKLATDSENLTYSESCVRSDIANIITKIYSPRPLMYCSKSLDSAVETRDIIGDSLEISRREKEGKLFGFYFEPVTRSFAKTFVDSSTTSGSVSLPIVRYKPKRLRHVCECCKRKRPFREHEKRGKRACRDCRVCNQNSCSDVGNSSTTVGPGRQGVDLRPSNSCKMNISNGDIVQVHPRSLKTSEEVDAASRNLVRKHSSVNLPREYSGKDLKRCHTYVKFDCSSIGHFNDMASNKHFHETQSFSSTKTKKVKPPSFLARVISKIFSKNGSSSVIEDDELRRMRHSYERFSKSSRLDIENEVKQRRNNDLSKNLSQVPLETIEINLSQINSTTNNVSRQTVPHMEESQLGNVFSCPEHVGLTNKSKYKMDGNVSLNEKRSDYFECNGNFENGLKNHFSEEKNPTIPGKLHRNYSASYKGLKIEKDTEWAYEFWAKVFSVCHSVVSFFTAFFLHLLTFVLQSLIEPLIFGTLRVSSDHFFKPCLSTALGSVIQPIGSLVEGSARSLRDICVPVAQCFGGFCKEVSNVCKACRVVEINKTYHFSEKPLNP